MKLIQKLQLTIARLFQEFRGLTADLRAQEESMKFGLEIFDIEPMSYSEVKLVEKEIEKITNIWDIKN